MLHVQVEMWVKQRQPAQAAWQFAKMQMKEVKLPEKTTDGKPEEELKKRPEAKEGQWKEER